MVPKLTKLTTPAVSILLIVSAVITVINAKTMIWGVKPYFDTASGVTFYNTTTLVGAYIGLAAALCILPTALLMLNNAIHNPSLRARSLMLGTGFLLIASAGPLHDTARTAALYAVADIGSILGCVILSAGVLYKIEERISVRRTALSTSS